MGEETMSTLDFEFRCYITSLDGSKRFIRFNDDYTSIQFVKRENTTVFDNGTECTNAIRTFQEHNPNVRIDADIKLITKEIQNENKRKGFFAYWL